jgi:hypothetical protein
VRAKYTRAYLEKHGLKPLKAKSIDEHMSPLERMIARAKTGASA